MRVIEKIKFETRKREHPNLPIWRRSREEQKQRNDLYKVLKNEKEELKENVNVLFDGLAECKNLLTQFVIADNNWEADKFIDKYGKFLDKLMEKMRKAKRKLRNCNWLNDEVALKLIEYWEEWYLEHHIDKFERLNPKVAEWLVRIWKARFVWQHLDEFHLTEEKYNNMCLKYWDITIKETLDYYDNLLDKLQKVEKPFWFPYGNEWTDYYITGFKDFSLLKSEDKHEVIWKIKKHYNMK